MLSFQLLQSVCSDSPILLRNPPCVYSHHYTTLSSSSRIISHTLYTTLASIVCAISFLLQMHNPPSFLYLTSYPPLFAALQSHITSFFLIDISDIHPLKLRVILNTELEIQPRPPQSNRFHYQLLRNLLLIPSTITSPHTSSPTLITSIQQHSPSTSYSLAQHQTPSNQSHSTLTSPSSSFSPSWLSSSDLWHIAILLSPHIPEHRIYSSSTLVAAINDSVCFRIPSVFSIAKASFYDRFKFHGRHNLLRSHQ